MSASREKKQRQDAGPSDKSAKVQQEQAARKRKTIAYTVTGVVIAGLVAALLIWNSGFFQARAAAATLGGKSVTTAELSYYYYSVRQNTAMYAAYGMSTFDTSVADNKQYYNQVDGVTYRDYFLEEALELAQQHMAMADESVKAGHTESEVKEAVDEAIESEKAAAASSGYSYAAYLRAMYGKYMTPAVYEKVTTRLLMANLVYGDKYTELYDSFSGDDLKAYYNEEDHADSLDTFEYSYLYFPVATVETKDEDGNDLAEDEVTRLQDAAKAEAKEKAEEALEAVQGGATFQSQIDKYELTAAADHAETVGSTSINSSFREELLGLGADECGLVELENGACYVISFHGRSLNEEPTRSMRQIVIEAEAGEEEHEDHTHAEEPTDEAWAAAKEKIDAIQAEWEAGGRTEDAFAALANEKSDDGDGTTGGLVEGIASTSTSVPAECLEWVFGDRQPGEVGLVQHSAEESDANQQWAYYLMYYVGEGDPVWMATVRGTLISEARLEWINGLIEAYPIAQAGGADYLGR